MDVVSWGTDRSVNDTPEGTVPPGRTVGRRMVRDVVVDQVVLLDFPSPGYIDSDRVPTVATTATQTSTPPPTATATATVRDIPTGGGTISLGGGIVVLVVPPGAADEAFAVSYSRRDLGDVSTTLRTVFGFEVIAHR